MSVTISFSTDLFDGLTAELYDTAFSPFSFAPDATDTVNNGRATFNLTPPNPFALRIADSGTGVARSGFLTLDAGEVDAAGDFNITFLVMRITDPADTTINPTTLTAGITPLTEGALTVTTLVVAPAPPNLRATGTGTYNAGILGNIPITFTYDFSLSPVGHALSSRVIDVDTVSTTVTGTSGGLLGFLVNAIVNLIGVLFNGTIADQIEDAVQEEVDQAVADAFAAANAPPEAFATLRSVVVNATSVVIDPFVLIPLSALDCGALVSSGSVQIRDAGQLRKLRMMRDTVLRGTPQGEAYIALFRQHSPEVIRILAMNPRLLKQVDLLVEQGLTEYSEEAPGKGHLSPGTAKLGKEVLQKIAEAGSLQLRRTIEMALEDVDQFVERPVSDVLEENTAAVRKLVRDTR
jgi:hypothetical protein